MPMATAAELAESLKPLIARVRTDVTAVKRGPGVQAWTREPLTDARLLAHVAGDAARGVGFIPAGESTTLVACLDLDSHKGEVPWEQMAVAAARLADELERDGLAPIVWRSSGGQGMHLYLVWDEPQDAYSVREQLREVVGRAGFKPGTRGLAQSEVEIFPKQDSVPGDGYGNQVVLPLAGQSAPIDLTLGCEVLPREAALSVAWTPSRGVPRREKPPRPEPLSTAVSPDLARLRAALAAIPNEGEAELGYDDWRDVIFALHYATGGSAEGFALANEFSARAHKYDPEFLEHRVWPYIRHERDNPITERTIFARAKQAGWREPWEADDLTDVPLDEPEAGEAAVPGRPRFYAFPLEEFLAIPRPQWLVKRLIPRAELVVVYGASGSGKSFWVLDVCAHVALGREWRGRKVRPGRVVYIAAEGSGGFRNRVEALCLAWDVDPKTLPLRVIKRPPNFLKDDDVAVAEAVKAADGATLIVVDTLARVTPGGNENAGEDMGLVLKHCERLHRATGAVVLLIHHTGKDESKGARGWSGIRAAVDSEIEISREQDSDARLALVTKQKDGSGEGDEYPFGLREVVLGQDEDGDDITSCVVETRETAVKPAREPRGAIEKTVYRTAMELLSLRDEVTDAEVINEAARALPHNPEKRDKRKEHAVRALTALVEQGFLSLRDSVVTV